MQVTNIATKVLKRRREKKFSRRLNRVYVAKWGATGRRRLKKGGRKRNWREKEGTLETGM